MAQFNCPHCGKRFNSEKANDSHVDAKHSKISSEKKPKLNAGSGKNNLLLFLAAIVIVVGILLFLLFGAPAQTVLPPTDIQGHVEQNPPSHISKTPFDIRVQKHMLEHMDGISGGTPGVVINYNCINFSCEPGLIEKLEAFTSNYSFVYVAPFPNMSKKIALTRYQRIETLDEFDKDKITAFITGN